MMNNKIFLYNAALIFGLSASGAGIADDATTMLDPASMTQQERDAYRSERYSSMSPEQRAEKQASHSHSGGAQGQGTMARDGSGSGGQHGRSGGKGRGR